MQSVHVITLRAIHLRHPTPALTSLGFCLLTLSHSYIQITLVIVRCPCFYERLVLSELQILVLCEMSATLVLSEMSAMLAFYER